MPLPRTLSQYVLKVHSRCDLACDHCYVYEHADQSWRTQPRVMATETVRAAAARIAEHALAHRLPRVGVVLHGGEPLLLGPRRLRVILDELRAAIDPATRLDLRMQTNGVLLSRQFCDLLGEYGVGVGVSLDGNQIANDRHRRFADGRSSYAAVMRALALLRQPDYRPSYGGILCTIDVRNDPIAVYEALLAENPPRIDFLLPHATWEQPPYRPADDPTPYARWLRRIFRRWLDDGRPVSVRLFDSLLSAASGGPSGTEAVGLDPADVAVIETDGTWEQVDSLKTTYQGAASTGLDVFTDPVDAVVRHPGIVARLGGLAGLSQTCQTCPVVDRCGGGLFAHRYRGDNGFSNPSVYCADLKEFITTMDQHENEARRPVRAGHGRDVVMPTAPDERAVLDDIGSGYGTEVSIAALADWEMSITRALLVAVRDAAPSAGPTATLVADAWELLGRLDTQVPEAVATVLGYPLIRRWAVDFLSRGNVAAGGDQSGVSTATYLAWVAAAAAIRARTTAAVVVPVVDGFVDLPTLGRLALPVSVASTAELTIAPEGCSLRIAGRALGAISHGTLDPLAIPDGSVSDGGSDAPAGGGGDGVVRWRPVPRVDIDGQALLIEDAATYRNCFGYPVAGSLPEHVLRDLLKSVTGAWQVIRRDVPAQLPGLWGVQRVLVPLAPDSHGGQLAATARHAFGAVGVAPAAAPEDLAVLLVHELQHAKLNAILDRYDLVDPHYRPRLRVPWRPDPRPVEGVLHGVYAHLAVADIWRARANGPGHREAQERYHRYQDWTVHAIEDLIATGALTEAGERFVGRMRQTVAGWPPVGGARR